jgi:D-lactate dehydrogenase
MTTAAPAPTLAVRTDLLTRVTHAHDASHVLLRPAAVARAHGVDGVVAALARARADGLPVTFRSGGTSLSGQAAGSGLLVDTRTGFTRVEVLDGGARVRCEPGVTLASVNARLAPYGRRLGPDPSSEVACTVGGVVANNSSGMACGTVDTAYRTVEGMTLVLASGTVLDTGAPDADARLRALEPALWSGLAALRDRVRGSASARAQIARQYAMKNTMGYAVNAFVDFDTPAAILEHLVVGSEGTLAFVADVTLRTVPALPAAATTLLVMGSLEAATDALPALAASGARAVELLDAASLRVAAADPQADPALRALGARGLTRETALLVEYQAPDAAALADAAAAGARAIAGLAGLADPGAPAALTTDAATRGRLWRARKGLYTAVAAARPAGSTALLEDVVVPGPALTAAVRGLQGLFDAHGYADAVVFGHAKDGNLHFMVTPDLGDDAAVATLGAFTEDLADLVLGHGGSLKAEHGTGRVMAPFVRRQFGDELYGVMREVKALADPDGLLNPGVVISDDPRAHLRDLKRPAPVGPGVDPELDRCVECGYCEPACPSRTLTTTPRQRIVLAREIAVATPAERAELERGWDYAAVDTCAADSLCVRACPVHIDTGKAMKTARARRHGPLVQRAGAQAAAHWAGAVTGLRGALAVADRVPAPVLGAASRLGRAVLGTEAVPAVGDDLPGPGPRRPAPDPLPPGRAPEAVFFSSCTGSLFAAQTADGAGCACGAGGCGGAGGSEADSDVGGGCGDAGAGPAFLALAARAGVALAAPDGVAGLCCTTPWASKGLTAGAVVMARQAVDALWTASDGGRLPVVCDASSCTHGLDGLDRLLRGSADPADAERAARAATLRVVDAVTFTRERLLPALAERGLDPASTGRRLRSVVVHPTCSTQHLGGVEDLRAVAAAVADDVVVPVDAGCCGFAGDRGMLHPELTRAATHAEAREVRAHEAAHGAADAYVSTNRTCELGLSRATGRPYRHVLEVLAELTRP